MADRQNNQGGMSGSSSQSGSSGLSGSPSSSGSSGLSGSSGGQSSSGGSQSSGGSNKDGGYGANFVIRSEDGELARRIGDELSARLREAGYDPADGGL